MQEQGLQPHREVQVFHAAHYSSNLMKGAVVGPQPIAELEALVRAKFDAVPNSDLPLPQFSGASIGAFYVIVVLGYVIQIPLRFQHEEWTPCAFVAGAWSVPFF